MAAYKGERMVTDNMKRGAKRLLEMLAALAVCVAPCIAEGWSDVRRDNLHFALEMRLSKNSLEGDDYYYQIEIGEAGKQNVCIRILTSRKCDESAVVDAYMQMRTSYYEFRDMSDVVADMDEVCTLQGFGFSKRETTVEKYTNWRQLPKAQQTYTNITYDWDGVWGYCA